MPTPTSSPRARRAWPWCPSGRTTPTAIRTVGPSGGSPVTGCRSTGPTGRAIWPSSAPVVPGGSPCGAGGVGPPCHDGGVTAAPVEPTSRLRVVMGEEELLRSRAVGAVRRAVLERHPDTEVHELTAAGLPIGDLADVLAPSLFGGHRMVVVSGVQECAAALAESLTSYAKDPDPDLTLVLVHFGGKRNEALVKAFTGAGAAL